MVSTGQPGLTILNFQEKKWKDFCKEVMGPMDLYKKIRYIFIQFLLSKSHCVCCLKGKGILTIVIVTTTMICSDDYSLVMVLSLLYTPFLEFSQFPSKVVSSVHFPPLQMWKLRPSEIKGITPNYIDLFLTL